MDDRDRPRVFAALVADADGHRGTGSTWSSIVDDAHVIFVTLQGVVAVGRAGAQDNEAPDGREALDRGIEALRDPVTSADREAREGIEEALQRLGRGAQGEASLDRILKRLESMDDSCVRELSGDVQGSLLAMQAQQALADGALPVPDGEVMTVVSDEETAGLTSATGRPLKTLAEVGGEVVPMATLAMAGAELAWAWARGGDVGVAIDRLWGRTARATVLSAVAHGVGMATGVEHAKVAIVVGGHVGTAAVERADRELAGSVDHVRGCRRILDGLASDVGAAP
jgi:hypothetical protein